MNNIFKNAYFGKQYKTRDGQKAIYWQTEPNHVDWHRLIVANDNLDIICYDNGFTLGLRNNHEEDPLDIVSEWKESINDEELEMLAFNNYCKDCHYCESANAKTLEEKYEACQKSECYKKTYVWKLINGYKAGYRKAKEG